MPDESRTDLSPLISSAGLYALGAFAQRGAGFLLIPVYTRLIDPADYGMLEILNAFAAVAFMCLTVGLPSAINKCYHRDCPSADDKASVLATALWIDVPVLLVGSLLCLGLARPLSHLLVRGPDAAHLLVLVVIGGMAFSLNGLLLATLRAQQRALGFSVLSLTQFVTGLGLNIVFVVGYGWGVEGVLWGNLLSNLLALPVALAVAARGAVFSFNRRLVEPLLRFGLFLIPVLLSGWVMDLSDRYVLRLYRSLGEVAIYGVGYKFGMIMQLVIVWPFQLAWPAFSFSISNQPGHQATYARALTYLTVVLVCALLALSLVTRALLPVLVGQGYRTAYRVVPFIALAYACNGIQYCVAPGVHIAGKTQSLSVLAAGAAVGNLVLNLLLIPRFGMMGAACSTVSAFLFLAVGTGVIAQRAYPVPYEYTRLAKVFAAGGLVYLASLTGTPQPSMLSVVSHLGMSLVAFPALLVLIGFLDDGERGMVRGFFRRHVPLFS